MALPSQMERGSGGGAVTGRNSRRLAHPAAKLAMIAGGVVVLGLVTWGIVGLVGGGGPQNAGATTNDAKMAELPKEVTEPTRGATPPPVSITQGGTQTGTRPTPVDVTGGSRLDGTNPAGATPTGTTPGTPTGTTGGSGTSPSGVTPGAVTPGNTPGPTPGSTPNNPGPTPGPGADGTTPPAMADQLNPTTSTGEVQRLISEGDRQLAAGKLVEARVTYSKALLHKDAANSDKQSLRTKLTTINDDLVFSTKVTPGDPLVEAYKVVSGDNLTKIRRKRELATDLRLIQRVNKLANPDSLKIGQTLKLVRGPFHAVVNKSDYRMDLYTGSPDEPDRWLFIKSYRVGLGADNGTPVGTYVVKKNSKLVNPHWVNPRTGEKFDQDDPKNPIGEYWMGWQGVGASAVNVGYGLHGTIEPDSIGQQRSMGCVRLGADDIAQVYDMLVEEISVVKVVP
jgi:LysM repeat protein